MIAAKFAYAEDFSEGFAVVGENATGLWYIDQNGNRAFPRTFKAAKAFFKGLAHVQLLPKGERAQRLRQAYIDTTGKQLFSYLSDVWNCFALARWYWNAFPTF